MATATFYYQERHDGGIRTGLGVDGAQELHRFTPGTGDPNPGLVWYIDVSVVSEEWPDNSDAVRNWLITNEIAFSRAINAAADQLELGLDDSDAPFQFPISGLPDGYQGRLSISAIRGLCEGDLASRLQDLAAHWSSVLEELAPFAHA
jgi:hypothetical protein